MEWGATSFKCIKEDSIQDGGFRIIIAYCIKQYSLFGNTGLYLKLKFQTKIVFIHTYIYIIGY